MMSRSQAEAAERAWADELRDARDARDAAPTPDPTHDPGVVIEIDRSER